jgi:outer membrane protein, heavy metal efflux system
MGTTAEDPWRMMISLETLKANISIQPNLMIVATRFIAVCESIGPAIITSTKFMKNCTDTNGPTFNFRSITVGLIIAAVIPLEVGCAVNSAISQNKAEQPGIVSSGIDGGKSERDTSTPPNTVAGKAHDSTAKGSQTDSSIRLVRGESQQHESSALRPIQAKLENISLNPVDEEPALNGMITLQELETLALENNPTISELAASTQKAAGYRNQVLTRPNPVVGYQGQQLADRGTDQHLAFIEREFVTGDKLELNQRVLNATLCAQLQELEAQRYRVTTDIRTRFYQALAIQKQIDLITEFSTVAEKGLKFAELRKEAGEGSQVDVLQSQILKSEVHLAKRQANAKLAAIWREISALAGVSDLPFARLDGTLPTKTDIVDWDGLAASLVASSPEYSAAQDRISRAHAALQRQQVQPIPNIAVLLGAGVDYGTNSGMLNLQVGVPLPVSNKNLGNIEAAQAEICRAQMEAQRIQNSIEARLAIVSKEYDTAVAAIETYSSDILPSASSSMKLADQAYQAGEVAFLQVLSTRKTFFDSNLQYINAQSQFAIAQAKIDGFVLTGALDTVRDDSGDASLRDLTFSQQ